jgi:hypothetical protein
VPQGNPPAGDSGFGHRRIQLFVETSRKKANSGQFCATFFRFPAACKRFPEALLFCRTVYNMPE